MGIFFPALVCLVSWLFLLSVWVCLDSGKFSSMILLKIYLCHWFEILLPLMCLLSKGLLFPGVSRFCFDVLFSYSLFIWLDSLLCLWVQLIYFLLDYWVFSFHLHFSLSLLQCFYPLIEFCSWIVDCLRHFYQPHVCVFLGITWAFILKFFLLNFIELFLCSFLKFLELFDKVYGWFLNSESWGSLR